MAAMTECGRDDVAARGRNDYVEEDVGCRFRQHGIEIRTDNGIFDFKFRRERTGGLRIHVDEPDDPDYRLKFAVRGNRLEPTSGHSSAPAKNCAKNHYSPPANRRFRLALVSVNVYGTMRTFRNMSIGISEVRSE
ncbi:hypothetical protein ACVJMZ_004486 [Sinorhizobium medicae]